jgi:hypothetical protein
MAPINRIAVIICHLASLSAGQGAAIAAIATLAF